MDWAKAKTIMIAALLLTNIFLLLIYGKIGDKEEDYNFDREAIMDFISERGILIESELPTIPKDMEIVFVDVYHSSEAETKALLDNENAGSLFALSQEEKELSGEAAERAYIEKAENFITALGLMNNQISLKEILWNKEERIREGETEGENSLVVKYKNIFEGVPIEKSFLNIYFQQGEIVDLEALWPLVTDIGKRKVQVMDPLVALLSLQGEVGEDIIVNKLRLVYYLEGEGNPPYEAVTDTILPAWEISLIKDRKFHNETGNETGDETGDETGGHEGHENDGKLYEMVYVKAVQF